MFFCYNIVLDCRFRLKNISIASATFGKALFKKEVEGMPPTRVRRLAMLVFGGILASGFIGIIPADAAPAPNAYSQLIIKHRQVQISNYVKKDGVWKLTSHHPDGTFRRIGDGLKFRHTTGSQVISGTKLYRQGGKTGQTAHRASWVGHKVAMYDRSGVPLRKLAIYVYVPPKAHLDFVMNADQANNTCHVRIVGYGWRNCNGASEYGFVYTDTTKGNLEFIPVSPDETVQKGQLVYVHQQPYVIKTVDWDGTTASLHRSLGMVRGTVTAGHLVLLAP